MVGYLYRTLKKRPPYPPLPSTPYVALHFHLLSNSDLSGASDSFLLHSLASGLSHFIGP